jgi:hypothetical protein
LENRFFGQALIKLMNEIDWKPKALKQVEKIKEPPRAKGFIPKFRS